VSENNKCNPAHDTIVALAELFPQCFVVFQGSRKPLKIGIREDLIAAMAGAVSGKEAGLALAIYCGNHGYLKACIKVGTPRIDLAGNVCGSVSAEEAANAKQRLAQQRAKQARRQHALASTPPDPGIVAGGIRDRARRAVLQRGPQTEDKQKTEVSRQFWKAFGEQDKRPAAIETKARNTGRISLADLRAAARARRVAAAE
jgi:sRNA-binding protein